jgi:hypothetical protein
MEMLRSLTGVPSMTMAFGHSGNRVGELLKEFVKKKNAP